MNFNKKDAAKIKKAVSAAAVGLALFIGSALPVFAGEISGKTLQQALLTDWVAPIAIILILFSAVTVFTKRNIQQAVVLVLMGGALLFLIYMPEKLKEIGEMLWKLVGGN